MGLLNLEALTSQLNLNAGFGTGHPNDLSVSRHEQNGPGNGFGGGHGGLLSNHHLHNGMGLGGLKTENHRQHQQQQGFLLDKQQQIPSKDWQDGLRALLPNVNVSFGALPQHGNSNGQSAADRMFSQQPAPGLSLTEQHHHHHERMQRQQHQSRPGMKNTRVDLTSQCGNFRILLLLRFHVKSILDILEVRNMPF